MAYCRYGKNCDWYIYWEVTESEVKEEQLLAVWQRDYRDLGPTINYIEAKLAFETKDYFIIPGFTESDFKIVNKAVGEFVLDVSIECESNT